MKTTEAKPLEAVAPLLGHAYTEWKNWEGRKNDYRDQFFQLADKELENRGRAIKMVEMPASSDGQATERIKRHYPGWKLDELRRHRWQEGLYEAVLSEEVRLMPFAYEHDGIKYAREISRGSVMVDDEWLKDADPELYEEITYELPWGERIVVPVEHLKPSQVGRLTKYIYHATPSVRLAKPRPVRTESE